MGLAWRGCESLKGSAGVINAKGHHGVHTSSGEGLLILSMSGLRRSCTSAVEKRVPTHILYRRPMGSVDISPHTRLKDPDHGAHSHPEGPERSHRSASVQLATIGRLVKGGVGLS